MTSYFYFHIIAIFYPDRRVWNFYRKKVLIMPKKKKKTMAVHEMAELLGLKKTDSYWLIHKQKFQTITVNGKTRVVIESFESAIDLLSFATIQLEEGRDWKQDAFLSLAGVFPYKREGPARCTGAISERSFWHQRNPSSSGQ